MLVHYQLVEVLPNGSHKTLMISSKLIKGLEKFPSLDNVYNGLMLSIFVSRANGHEKIFEIHTWFDDNENE